MATAFTPTRAGSPLGRPTDRIDGKYKTTGTAPYAADHEQAERVHLHPVQATIARGRIAGIDTSAAEAPSKPDGEVARLAMIRFPAAGQKIGSLVINPGGPGESGVESAVSLLSGLPQAVKDRFDIVGFDPRGVGSSTPAVWCNSDEDNDRLRADPTVEYTPEGVEHLVRLVVAAGDRVAGDLAVVDRRVEGLLGHGVDGVRRDELADVEGVGVVGILDAGRRP